MYHTWSTHSQYKSHPVRKKNQSHLFYWFFFSDYSLVSFFWKVNGFFVVEVSVSMMEYFLTLEKKSAARIACFQSGWTGWRPWKESRHKFLLLIGMYAACNTLTDLLNLTNSLILWEHFGKNISSTFINFISPAIHHKTNPSYNTYHFSKIY